MKKVIKSSLFALLFSFVCAGAFAAESDLDRYVTGLEKQYAAMKDFYAEFEQQTRLASVNYIEKGH